MELFQPFLYFLLGCTLFAGIYLVDLEAREETVQGVVYDKKEIHGQDLTMFIPGTLIPMMQDSVSYYLVMEDGKETKVTEEEYLTVNIGQTFEFEYAEPRF